jgi:hypothetical protein
MPSHRLLDHALSQMIDRQTLLRDAITAELQTMKPDVRFRD